MSTPQNPQVPAAPAAPASVPVSREQSIAIFSQTMGLVAITCLFAALGAWIGRDLGGLWFLLPWILALGCIIGLNVANARGMTQLALVLLFATGLLLGISIGYTVKYYAVTDASGPPRYSSPRSGPAATRSARTSRSSSGSCSSPCWR
jgi:FtsH-binding integral membrane protein